MNLNSNNQISTCEVSGLPIYLLPEFHEMKVCYDYFVTFKKIGTIILLAEARGDMKYYDFHKYTEFRSKAIKAYFPKGEIFVDIKDFTLLTNIPSINVRKLQKAQYISEFEMVYGFIIFNVNILLRTAIKFALKLELKNSDYQMHIKNSYTEAIKLALDLVNKKAKHSHSKEDIDHEEIVQIKRKDIEKLKYKLSTITWETNDDTVITPENPELDDIFNIIELIKKDYYNIINELQERNEELTISQDNLNKNVTTLENIIDTISIGVVLVKLDTKEIVHANHAMEQLLSLDKDSIRGRTCANLFSDFDKCDCPFDLEKSYCKNNYSMKIGKIPVLKTARLFLYNSEEHVLMTFVDITKRKEMERKNRAFQNDLILLSSCASDLIFLNNADSVLKYIGKGVQEFISNSVVVVSKFNKKQQHFKIIDIIKDIKLVQDIKENKYISQLFTLPSTVLCDWLNLKFKNISKEDDCFPQVLAELRITINVYDQVYVCSLNYDNLLFGVIYVFTNKKSIGNIEIINSFINQSSMALYKRELEENLMKGKRQAEDSLKTKEILLKEVHHRVKNNMAVITSLLKLQSSAVKDPILDKAFMDSRNRIKSMALVHEKLYDGGDLESIDFGDYLKTLIKHLLSSYRFINIRYEIKADNIYIDLDTAISLGLLVNEIITNSMKYAFADSVEFENGEKEALIFVYITKQDKLLCMNIGDNGKGMPEKYGIGKTDSLGMELIYSLSQQIDAKASLSKENGTVYTISFPNKMNHGE